MHRRNFLKLTVGILTTGTVIFPLAEAAPVPRARKPVEFQEVKVGQEFEINGHAYRKIEPHWGDGQPIDRTVHPHLSPSGWWGNAIQIDIDPTDKNEAWRLTRPGGQQGWFSELCIVKVK